MKHPILTVCAILLGASSLHAIPATFRVNFYQNANTTEQIGDADTWDDVSNTSQNNLIINNKAGGGTATLSTSVSWSGGTTDQAINTGDTALDKLFYSHLFLGVSARHATISNLPALDPGQVWELTIYADSNNSATDGQNRSGDFTVTDSVGTLALRMENIDGGTTSILTHSGTPSNGPDATRELINKMVFTELRGRTIKIEVLNLSGGQLALNGFTLEAVAAINPLAPVIASFTSNSPTIPLGSSATLSWMTHDAVTLAIDQGVGDVTGAPPAANGSITVSPSVTTTYTLTATNTEGAVTEELSVTVLPPAAPSIESFTATPRYFATGGTTVDLAWQTTGADTLSIDQGVGDVTSITSTGTTTSVSGTTTFTLTASNTIGTTTAMVTVREAAPGPRPNILFFLVDDMGWQDTSQPFHTERTLLNSRFRTPNMESLAAQGRRFTQAYACTICSPTRVSLMTGMNAARHKVTNWTKNKDSENSGTTAVLKAPSQWNINGLGPASETYQRVYNTDQSLPRILQQAGYRTIHSGKAHFGAGGLQGANPQSIGFDVNIAGTQNGGPGSYLGSAHYGTGSWHVPGLEAYYPEANNGEDIFLTEALTREINKSIETAVSDGVPFFAYMAHYAVHVPFALDARFSANYQDLDSTERKYAAMVEGMDKSLGDILAKVDALGVAENTLVIFYSDNGGLSFTGRGSSPYGGRNTHNHPLRAGKGSAYEGGIRVPFIAAWAKPDPTNAFQQNYPIPQNTICDSPVIIEDLMPTVLTAAGLVPPENIDGFDITGYIQDTPGFRRPNDTFLFHYPHVWTGGALGQNQGYEPYSAMRDGDWKIIYLYHNTRWELYHLPDDIHEDTNLTARNPDKFMEMGRKMIQLLEARGAQYPENRVTSEPIPLVLPVLPAVDLDGDGISDNTEDPNSNGLVDPGETDPDKADTDGDRFSDGEEAAAGTDPLNPGDFFSSSISGEIDGRVTLHWRSNPGLFYTLQASGTLGESSWADIETKIPAAASGTTTSHTPAENPDPWQFYRVGVE